MRREGGIVPSFWYSPLVFYFALGMFIAVTFLVSFQLVEEAIVPYAGGAIGCAIGGWVSSGLTCVVGGGVGAIAATEFLGGSADVGVHVDAAANVKQTSTYLPQLLAYKTAPGEDRLGDRLQRYLYCATAANPPPDCDEATVTDVPADLENAAAEIIPAEREHRVIVLAGGTTYIQHTSGSDDVFEVEQTAAVYQLILPLPGGERGAVKLLVEGSRGGVIWEP